tara:strand:+ start:631 stop:783 length:153 start_codon:yes stop_codon:yes gene_type:complete
MIVSKGRNGIESASHLIVRDTVGYRDIEALLDEVINDRQAFDSSYRPLYA